MRQGNYFEDLREGEQHHTRGLTVTEDAIVRFGLEWDMQPFHVDAEAAKSSMFGTLIASGLHTVVITYRLYDQLGLLGGTGLAGLGYNDIRFLKPVRPGDTLRVRVTVEELKASNRPDRGIATIRLQTRNQDGVEVLSMSVSILVACRSAGESSDKHE